MDGAGVGIHSASQTVKQSIYCSSFNTSSNPSECSGFEGNTIKKVTESNYSGLGLFGEIGWQGYEGFYFTISVTAGASVKLSEEDNTQNVINYSNHLDKVGESAL